MLYLSLGADFLLSGFGGDANAAVTMEPRTLANPDGTYVMVSSDSTRAPSRTLIIFLQSTTSTAADFAKLWAGPLAGRDNIAVAVTEAIPHGIPNNVVTAIIADAVARDHVNPKHVVLMEYGIWAWESARVLNAHPEAFAGYGAIGTDFPPPSPTPALLGRADKLAVYYAFGTGSDSVLAYDLSVGRIKNYGFTRAVTEKIPEAISSTAFQQTIKKMLSYFDQALAENDRSERQGATVIAKNGAGESIPMAQSVKIMPVDHMVVEERPLGVGRGAYFLLAPNLSRVPAAKAATLLICFHGAGDSALDFCKIWLNLVDHRTDLIVAVPDHNQPGDLNPVELTTRIIQETVARDHVDPKRVFIVGLSAGGYAAGSALGTHPDWFAGFGLVASDLARELFSPRFRKYADQLAVYHAIGTKDELFGGDYAKNLAQFKDLGVTNIFAENPPIIHTLTADEIAHMMKFFDQSLRANDQKQAQVAAAELALQRALQDRQVVSEVRTLGENGEKYVFLAPDREKFPVKTASTLLICLHGAGDTAANFATMWEGLVAGRRDVVVALPENTNSRDVVPAIVEFATNHDHVNPQHVILMGYDEGGIYGAKLLAERPELFAGFAGFATNFAGDPASKNLAAPLTAPALLKNSSRVAVFYAVGKRDSVYKNSYASVLAQLKQTGFANLQAESPDYGHYLFLDEFTALATRMMIFFDLRLAANDKNGTPGAATAN